MPSKNNDIQKLREKIRETDRKIAELLVKRMELAKKIGEQKLKLNIPVFQPSVELEILKEVARFEKPGVISKAHLIDIWREILSVSRSLQSSLKIAYLGPEATFTHQAALKVFGKWASYVPVKRIADVFREVEKERCNWGVVPIENSTEGVVTHTLDMLAESELKICAEVHVNISLCLVSEENSIEKIKLLFSHPHAIAQCSKWIEENLKEVQIKYTESTASAARMCKEVKNSAAVASEIAAKIYNLNILAKNIEDTPENVTRFLVIGKKEWEYEKPEKTSIVCSIKDRVGALHSLLEPFAKAGINLTRIESRPSRKKPWEYLFFIDFQGSPKEKHVREALKEAEKQTIFLKILGAYSRWP